MSSALSIIFLILIACFVFLDSSVYGAALQAVGVQNALNHVPPNAPLGNGRQLIVKQFPGVENYQSDLYEVYVEPYTYVSGKSP